MLDLISNCWNYLPCLTVCVLAVLIVREKPGRADRAKPAA